MRSLLAVAVVLCCACGVGAKRGPASNTSALECSAGDVPIYSNRYAPASGASGVASAADAEAGYVSSDAKGSGPTTTVENQVKQGEEHTAMVVECGQATCAEGQVAISLPPVPSGGGVDGVDDLTGDDAPPPPPAPNPAPMGTTKCVAPPPSCPTGQSAQYTLHDTWECTDCAMVVTYGGIYGNYRRCVSAPTIVCPGGEVPTFSFELETWECKPTCDNGLYDQHTISGQLVCVPC